MGSQSTITEQHTLTRVKQIAQDVADSMTPRPRLTLNDPPFPDLACADDQQTYDDRAEIWRDYDVTVKSADDKVAAGQQVLRRWKQEKYRIIDTIAIGTDVPSIYAVTADNFQVSFTADDSLKMSVGMKSPCVWPHGTPPPWVLKSQGGS